MSYERIREGLTGNSPTAAISAAGGMGRRRDPETGDGGAEIRPDDLRTGHDPAPVSPPISTISIPSGRGA